MATVFSNRVVQPVRVRTSTATFDGLLTVGLGHRTIDELNLDTRPFLTLQQPTLLAGTLALDAGPLAINKGSILVALEVPELCAPLPTEAAEAAIVRAARTLVRLQLPDFSVEGYLLTARGADALTRLNQTGRRFVALTSAVLKGSGFDGAVPFVAVNMAHVQAAQALLAIEANPEEPGGEVVAA